MIGTTKLAIIADVHIRPADLMVGRDALEGAFRSMIENDVDVCIVAGDLFDGSIIGDQRAGTGEIVGHIAGLFTDFVARGKEIYLLLGNHEVAGAGQAHALHVFRGIEGVEIVDMPRAISVRGVHIAMMPFIPTYNIRRVNDKYAQWLQTLAGIADMPLHDRSVAFYNIIDGLMVSLSRCKADVFVWHCSVDGAEANSSGKILFGDVMEMTLMRDRIAEVAPVYAGGHYHKRQFFDDGNNGYVGALRQTNRGETGNKTGYRLLEIKAEVGLRAKVCSDIFIEVETRKFYVYENVNQFEPGRYDEMRAQVEAGHYVEARGDVCADYVPKGVNIRREPDKKDVVRRFDISSVPTNNQRDILDKWAEANNCFLVGKMEAAIERLGIDICEETRVGSLTKIIEIELHNITKHRHTVVNVEQMEGIISIDGDIGAGKTSILDALMLALYNIAPSYNNANMYVMMTHGCTEEAWVRVIIETKKELEVNRWQIKRSVTKDGRRSHVCKVEKQIMPGLWSDYAGGKNRTDDADAKIRHIVGMPEMITNTIYAVQGGQDICDMPASKRREFLAMMIDTNRYLAVAQEAKKECNRISIDIARKSGQIEAIDTMVKGVDVKDYEDRKTKASALLVENRGKLVECERREKELYDRMRADQQLREKYIAEVATYRNYINLRDRIGNDIAECQRKRNYLRFEKDKLIYQPIEETEIEAMRAKRASLVESIAEAQAQKISIAEQLAKYEAENVRIEKHNRENEDRYQYEYRQWRDEVTRATRVYDQYVNQRKSQQQAIKSQIEAAGAKAQLLKSKDIGCEGKLQCCFLSDAQEAATRISSLQTELDNIEKMIEGLNRSPEYTAYQHVSNNPPIKVPATDNSEVKHNIAVCKSDVETQDRRLKELYESIGEIDSLLQVVERNRSVGQRRADYDRDIAEVESRIGDLRVEEKQLKVEIEPVPPSENEGKEIERLNREYKATRMGIETMNNDLAVTIRVIEEKLNEVARQSMENEQNRSQLLELKESLEVYSAITRAYGRDGIPQMYLDSIVPRIAQITDQLLNSIGYEARVVFRTQSVTQDGKVNEDLDIEAWDGEVGAYRDIHNFSGGEGTILRLAVRLAFALYQSERWSDRYRVFIADEAFSALKPHWASQALTMLESLKCYKQILVISHTPEVVNSIRQGFYVKKVDGISHVEVKR